MLSLLSRRTLLAASGPIESLKAPANAMLASASSDSAGSVTFAFVRLGLRDLRVGLPELEEVEAWETAELNAGSAGVEDADADADVAEAVEFERVNPPTSLLLLSLPLALVPLRRVFSAAASKCASMICMPPSGACVLTVSLPLRVASWPPAPLLAPLVPWPPPLPPRAPPSLWKRSSNISTCSEGCRLGVQSRIIGGGFHKRDNPVERS